MPAVELMSRRIQIADNAFASIRILEVDPAILGSQHQYKYSLAYIVDGVYNERGKGDHKHIGEQEYPVKFTTIENMIASFQADLNLLRR